MQKQQSKMLDQLLDARAAGRVIFTEWEEEFLENMDNLPDDAELSDKRVAAIIRIHQRYGNLVLP